MLGASPQVENGFVRIANEIWDEVIRRDFSKRQKDILLFIWRLSYGCQKKTAIIPMLKDFAMCGVAATQITGELKYLETCRVLFWDRESGSFEFNKSYDLWQVNPVKGWDADRFKELLHTNLHTKHTSQNMKSDFIKHEVITSQNMKSDFIKHEVEEDSKPCGPKAEDTSKDSIKDSIKDNVVLLDVKRSDTEHSESKIMEMADEVEAHFIQKRGRGISASTLDYQHIKEMIVSEIPVDFIKSVLNKCFAGYVKKHARDEIRSISYCVPFVYDAWMKHNEKVRPFQKGGQAHDSTQDPSQSIYPAGGDYRQESAAEQNSSITGGETGWIRTKRNADLQVPEMQG